MTCFHQAPYCDQTESVFLSGRGPNGNGITLMISLFKLLVVSMKLAVHGINSILVINDQTFIQKSCFTGIIVTSGHF